MTLIGTPGPDSGKDRTPQNPEESHKARVDRELGELLQGLRVAATGVQVMFAFLLTLPFSTGFGKVDQAGRWLFYVAMLSSAVASICFIAPATQQRILFRTTLKELMLRRANRLGVVGGIALSVAMTCSTGLVVESFLGVLPAALLAGAVAGLSGWLWFVQPLVSKYGRRGRAESPSDDQAQQPSDDQAQQPSDDQAQQPSDDQAQQPSGGQAEQR